MNKGTLDWLEEESKEIRRKRRNVNKLANGNRRTVLEYIVNSDTTPKERERLIDILNISKGE